MVLAAEELSSGSSSSARRTPDRLDVLAWLGCGIPVLFYLWFLHHYTQNVVRLDQWSDVTLIRASYDGHLSLAALWAQHNENRMLFPNLIVLALSRLDAFDISTEEYLSGVLLLAAVALIVAAHTRRSPGRRLIAYCPVVILMVSVVQAQNTLWGFQLAWYLILGALAGVIFVLDRPTLSVLSFAGAAILAVVGSYSSFQGLLIWVAGLVLLLFRQRPRPLVAAWVVVGVLTTAVYFDNFESAVPSNLTPIHLPGRAVQFYFESLGDVLGVRLSSGGAEADVVAAFGCVIVALALYTVWLGLRHRDPEGAAPVGIALIVFGLLFALSTTYGRAWGGPGAAAASRYTTYDLLVLVGAYLTYIGLPVAARSPRPSPRVPATVLGVLLGGAITLVAVFGLVNGIKFAQSSQDTSNVTAAVTVDADHLPGPVVRSVLAPWISAAGLRDDVHMLAAHRLTFFADAQAVASYRRLAATATADGYFHYTPPPPTQVEQPRSGAVLSGTTPLFASAAPNLHPVRVDFVISAGGQPPQVLATKQTPLGWAVPWRTSTVPNGSYRLESVVHGRSGGTTTSAPVQVVVRNDMQP